MISKVKKDQTMYFVIGGLNVLKEINVPVSGRTFKNNVSYCVGTGRMGLALQKEYIDHLKLVQQSIKFQYIRGHGLFCDDVGISDLRTVKFNIFENITTIIYSSIIR